MRMDVFPLLKTTHREITPLFSNLHNHRRKTFLSFYALSPIFILFCFGSYSSIANAEIPNFTNNSSSSRSINSIINNVNIDINSNSNTDSNNAYTTAALADQITNLPGASILLSNQFSGYLQISSTKHIHYFFVESENDPEKDPLFIWTNGNLLLIL